MEKNKELSTKKQCDIHVVMCSLLKDLKESTDYLEENKDYWIKQENKDKVIAYNTCIEQMELLYDNYKNYI